MEWVEIPTQRVLRVTDSEQEGDFEVRGDEGAEKLFIRRKDGRVFRYADIQPANAYAVRVRYLSEV